ncbi:heme lyase CcmF/NrfE family subunit [Usitatibacter palustris]|uniref:Cytochrome c-type biogenesis protein CcmF n=1 Tax=Usitatibacter palustris TaxID=2732487 RepID=A0A6M4H5R6_9PROT|nr:heme lyase CcmF/NrfE family subunit [Usitatibacter palustris]QJR15009.1 Cytochrome c-type biogenesis protein CcmF [Usitatibacter palustris]
MIPELGQFALGIALALALAQAILPLIGAATGRSVLMAVARPAAAGQFIFVFGAFLALVSCFVANDFSVVNVATNSNSKLPTAYRVAASWGSHEGSMLLWTLMLASWTFAVVLFSRHLPDRVVARVIGVMGLVSAGFLLFMLATSNPFDRLLPPAGDGRDLNPLLQDPGMVIHPPMLYMGYVGFSIAFSFAIAALLEGRLDAAWARWSRPWTTAAWCFLTIGIALGSWWAYYELGWGGWWFWDPVENASFMPWLAGTALVHSLAVTEKRGTFRSWTVLLAITAFSLSLVGTFLVRSGVLTSVHAFATDPARGVFILGFLSLVIGGSLALFAWRAPRVGLGGGFAPVSRESFLLANNVLLVVALSAVMLGTLYPLFLDALNLGKISVGPPYFDAVFFPLMAPAIFLMAAGPIASWKSTPLPALRAKLQWAFGVAFVLALVVPFVMGRWSPMVAFGLLLAFWVIAATFAQVKHRLAASPQPTALAKFRAQPAAWHGMNLAHLGVAVFIVGVTLVKGYETERDVRMVPGDKVEIGSREFTFRGTREVPGPNYLATRGEFDVRRIGSTAIEQTMHPEKRVYHAAGQTMTEADISTGFFGDLYVSLGEPVGDGAWGVRLYHKPFVDWIWGGCFIMALGGFLAIADRRYRPRVAATAPEGAAQAAAD